MANENLKKFLDSAGVSHLWTKIDKKVKDEIKDLKDNVIGDFGKQTVKAYIDEKTANIGGGTEVEKLKSRMETAEGEIDALQEAAASYATKNELKSYASKQSVTDLGTELTSYKESNDLALANVKTTAEAAVTQKQLEDGLATRALQSEFVGVKELVDNFFADEASVDEKLDQLKEIVAYLNSLDGDTVGEIIEDIAAIETKINNVLNLGTKEDGTDISVPEYVAAGIAEALKDINGDINAAIEAFKNGDFKDATDRITALETKVNKLPDFNTLMSLLDMPNYTIEGQTKQYTVVEYINTLALTNEEIDIAIGANQTTN